MALKRPQDFDHPEDFDSDQLFTSLLVSNQEIATVYQNVYKLNYLVIFMPFCSEDIYKLLYKNRLKTTPENYVLVDKQVRESWPKDSKTEEQIQKSLKLRSCYTRCMASSGYSLDPFKVIVHALNMGLNLDDYENYQSLLNHVRKLAPSLVDQIESTSWLQLKIAQEQANNCRHIESYRGYGFSNYNTRLRYNPNSCAAFNKYMAKYLFRIINTNIFQLSYKQNSIYCFENNG